MGDIVFAEIILDPDDVTVFVLGHFDIASAGHKRLDVRFQRFAQRPHHSVSINPGKFRIDQLIDHCFIAFLEGGRNRAIGGDDFIVGGGCTPSTKRGEDASCDDNGKQQSHEPSLHLILLNAKGLSAHKCQG